MCRRVLNNEPINEQLIRDYELGKLGKENVSLVVLQEPLLPAPFHKFTLRSLGGGFLRAIGVGKPKQPAPASVQLSKSKRRGRLFEGMQLGSIENVDQKLKKEEEKK